VPLPLLPRKLIEVTTPPLVPPAVVTVTSTVPVPAEDLDPLMKRTVPVWFRYRRGGEA